MFQEELGDDINTEAASEAARHLLDDFRFVYGRPDAPVSIVTVLFHVYLLADCIAAGQ